MKKVIITESLINTINLENIHNNHIVGIVWESGKKAILIEQNGNYYAMNQDRLKLTSIFNPNIKDYLEARISVGSLKEIYVFETLSECFKWMSE